MPDDLSVSLEIAIPTYNRAENLQCLCDSIRDALKCVPRDAITVSIYDNASTDATTEVLSTFAQECACVRVVRHASNIGGAANITHALSNARAAYVWLLSDHMLLEPDALPIILKVLRDERPSVLYCHISDYGLNFSELEQSRELRTLSGSRIAELYFGLSNVSGILSSRELIEKAREDILECGQRSFPHLGIWNRFVSDRRYRVAATIRAVSSFQRLHGGSRYNWFSGALDYGEVFGKTCALLGMSMGDLMKCKRFFRTCLRTLASTDGPASLPSKSQVERFKEIYGLRGALMILGTAPFRWKYCGHPLRFRPDAGHSISRFD